MWTSAENRNGTVRTAYSGEFLAHCETRAKSSRPGRMVAVLLVRELKHLQKNFPQRGFLHWYPIMRREAGALNACASIVYTCKCIRASQNDSKKKNSIADINHTCIPHRNRLLTNVRFSNS